MSVEKATVIGIDRAFLAEVLTDTSAAVTYGTPFEIPSVSQITRTQNSSTVIIPSDNKDKETVLIKGAPVVAISLAGLDGATRATVEGGTYLNGDVSYATDSVKPTEYALGYRRKKSDESHKYVWFRKGVFSRPDATSNTTGNNTITPNPDIYMYTGIDRTFDGKKDHDLDSDDVGLLSGVNDTTLNSSLTGWFSSPDYVVTAIGTPISDLVASTGASSGQIALAFSAATGATSIIAQVFQLDSWVTVSTAVPITAASTTAIIISLVPTNTYNCRLVVIGGANNGISNEDSAAALA